MDDITLAQTLEELEDERWRPPNYDSYLVKTVHRLRAVPIRDLTTEDLRLLLGQQIGTRWLIPLALDRLKVEPMAMGDFFPGDLLSSVLETEPAYWETHTDQLWALHDVRMALQAQSKDLERILNDKRWPNFSLT